MSTQLPRVFRLVAVAAFGLTAACQLAELQTPQSGSCSDAVRENRWPQFEGNDGEVPLYPEAEIGWGEGLVPPDFELTDQFGDPICLWQMVGKHVVLDASALWCEPCKQIAKKLPCTAGALGDDVVFMTLITEDNRSLPADQSHSEAWSTTYELDQGTQTPVIADGGKVVASGFSGVTLPSLVLLDTDLRWTIAGADAGAELPILNALEEATGNTVSCEGEEAEEAE